MTKNNSSQEYKRLITQRRILQEKVDRLKQKHIAASSAYNHSLSTLRELNEEISQYAEKDVILSEHAILRYIERAGLCDIETIRKTILSDTTLIAIKNLGDGQYPVGDKLYAVVQDNVIVTIK